MEQDNQTANQTNPTEGTNVQFSRLSPSELRDLKLTLLNTMSAALINQPRFSLTNPTYQRITKLAKSIAFYDPEFILKLALYVRDDLNIRTAANYLVALASNLTSCQPYVTKYFSFIVRLPSDWLDIAATYLILPDKQLQGKSLPTCLRKAMVAKFPHFDAYQLGKYNKERTIKRKMKKMKENPGSRTLDKPMLTIKHMIRRLHISSPAYSILCILGKKYPLNESEFRMLGLPGDFDPDRAGTRMKLPVPETWETLLSAKGNNAATWEELIEHKKLPFMAMLRNIRNLIFAGVHPRYHRWVQNRLSNEMTVIRSRQFPFRFFSAYEVIPTDSSHFNQLLEKMNKGGKEVKGKDGKTLRRKRKKEIVPAHTPPPVVFDQYRAALDKAVKLATTFNVTPISGSTVVFCNVGSGSEEGCSGARGMGNSVRNIQEVGYLLGLMCKYVCEECDFRIYASPGPNSSHSHLSVDLVEGTILENMSVVKEKANELGNGNVFPFDYLEDLIRCDKKIDNLIVFSHQLIDTSDTSQSRLASLLKKYRRLVNEDLLFVSVDLSGKSKGSIGESEEANPRDIMVAGFSDQILRFIAERGGAAQLQYVEHIDDAKGVNKEREDKDAFTVSPWWRWLDQLKDEVEQPLTFPNITTGEKWRDCRVFISSTFVDMHAERDVLTRIVFPELKERCKKLKVHLHEIDLRWGITEEESQMGRVINRCLEEVDNCRPFFLAMLGTRYGWAPTSYDGLPEDPKYAWVKNYPTGRSITELEIQYAALTNPEQAKHSFFFLRSSDFVKKVPKGMKKYFIVGKKDKESKEKLENLKERIRSSGLPVFDNYPAVWRGMEEGKAMVEGLDEFSERAFEWLWGAIRKEFPKPNVPSSLILAERMYHQDFCDARTSFFYGRNEELASLRRFANGKGKMLVVEGTTGDGKSSLLAKFAQEYAEMNPTTFVLPHFISASPQSVDIRRTLWRLVMELKSAFQLDMEVPEEYQALVQAFPVFLEEASFKGRLIIILDAIDQLNDDIERAQTLDWLPLSPPCKIIVSANKGSKALEAVKRRKGCTTMPVPLLQPSERATIVREILWRYRKKLDERPMNTQMRLLCKKKDAGKPLYLIVACEELRVFGVYERVSDKIKDLGMSVPLLFNHVLVRLEKEHGAPVVKMATQILAIARGGLLESELLDIITKEHNLDFVKYQRFYRSLSPFLKQNAQEGETRITLFHSSLEQAVTKKYLTIPNTAKEHAHALLAKFFLSRAKKNGEWQTGDARAISEVIYHLVHAKDFKNVAESLTDINLCQVKCSLGMTHDLLYDYSIALEMESYGTWDARSSVREFHRFLQANVHILSEQPELLFQQAMNQPDDSAPRTQAEEVWKAGNTPVSSWIQYLNKPQEMDFCKMTIANTGDSITAVAISPDGKRIASAGRDCSIKIFDASSGRQVECLTGHSGAVVALTFSPSSRELVSASWDKSAKIWDLYVGGETATLSDHRRQVSDAIFSRDGSEVLTASWDCTLRLWSSFDGARLKPWFKAQDPKPFNSCAFSPDSKRVIGGSWDGKVSVFNREDGSIIFTLEEGKLHSIRSIAYSPAGKHIVTGSLDRKMMIWDAVAAKPISLLRSHADSVQSLSFTQDSMHILSAGDITLKVWDGNLGKESSSISMSEGYMNTCSFNPTDDNILATGSADGELVLWDISDERELIRKKEHTRPINYIEYSPDGKEIATAGDDGLIVIWNDSGELKKRLKWHREKVNNAVFSPVPGDRRLASASDDFNVVLWNLDSGELLLDGPLTGHDSTVKHVAFSPNGKLLVSASRDTRLRVWDSRNGNCVKILTGHLDWINACHFSPDGNRVVSCSWDYNLKIWNVRTGKATATMYGHNSSASFCRFTPDGSRVISSSFDTTIKIWDAQKGSEITTLKGHESRINGFAISKDGGKIASVSDDGTIKIWDPLSATQTHSLSGHAKDITCATFNPESKKIVSGSKDGSVKLWDLGIGEGEESSLFGSTSFTTTMTFGDDKEEEEEKKAPLCDTLKGHDQAITSLCLSPDASTIVSAASDAPVASIWEVESGKRIRQVKHSKGKGVFLRAVAMPPTSDHTLVTAGDDSIVKVWDLRSRSNPKKTKLASSPLLSLALAPNGQLGAAAGWDGSIYLWDLRYEKLGGKLSSGTNADWIVSLGFNCFSSQITSASSDGSILLWNVRGFAGNVQTPLSNGDWVTGAVFSPDGTHIASGDVKGLVKVWNIAKRETVHTFLGHEGNVTGVTYSPLTKEVVSVGKDKTVRIWGDDQFLESNLFHTGAPCTTVSVQRDIICVGDSIGNLYLLKTVKQ